MYGSNDFEPLVKPRDGSQQWTKVTVDQLLDKSVPPDHRNPENIDDYQEIQSSRESTTFSSTSVISINDVDYHPDATSHDSYLSLNI